MREGWILKQESDQNYEKVAILETREARRSVVQVDGSRLISLTVFENQFLADEPFELSTGCHPQAAEVSSCINQGVVVTGDGSAVVAGGNGRLIRGPGKSFTLKIRQVIPEQLVCFPSQADPEIGERGLVFHLFQNQGLDIRPLTFASDGCQCRSLALARRLSLCVCRLV